MTAPKTKRRTHRTAEWRRRAHQIAMERAQQEAATKTAEYVEEQRTWRGKTFTVLVRQQSEEGGHDGASPWP